jgi:hypothetical protein
MQRLRTELRDLLELVLLPGLAAVLPWRWCFALFRRLARVQWLYRGPCLHALAGARAYGREGLGDEADWMAMRRLVTLVDHADLYLALTRSDGWMRRHMSVQGQWPAPGQAGLLLSFHWGAGMWGLRSASAHGLDVHALVAATEGAPFAGRTVLHRYALARTRCVGRALRNAPLVVSGSLRPVVQALRRNEQVLAVVDVPADQVSASLPVALCGRTAHVPKGLLRLAVDMHVPVTVYVTGFDAQTGRRQLRVHSLGMHGDVQVLAGAVFRHLQECMDESHASWHFWGEASRFFD